MNKTLQIKLFSVLMISSFLLASGCAFTTVGIAPPSEEPVTKAQILSRWGKPYKMYTQKSFSPAARKIKANNADELWIYRGSGSNGLGVATDDYCFFRNDILVREEVLTWGE